MFSMIESLAELPVRFISTQDFPLKNGAIGEVVRVMSKLKYLEFVEISEYHWSGYKLSLQEFKLFRHLPIECMDVEALCPEDLHNHLSDFLILVNEMMIPDLRYDRYSLLEEG